MNTNQQRDDSYRGPLSPSGWHCIRDVDDCGSLATADAPPLLGKYRLGSVLQRFILFLDFFSIVACNHIHSSSSQQYQVLHQHHYHPQISSWCKSRTKLQGRCVSRISANVNATVADGLRCRIICGIAIMCCNDTTGRALDLWFIGGWFDSWTSTAAQQP